jgi:uncharacterized protein YqjF (DUF2071 family)
VKRNSTNKEFLRANWLRMASANYEVDPVILKKYLPFGTELEAHNGKHYVSLVAFRYCQTRLLNVPIPFHRMFEEINLRFYVKREVQPGVWRSEVAFTKLFFPKTALTLVAKYVYKENYETVKMLHEWKEDDKHLITNYGLKNGDWHNFDLVTSKEAVPVLPGSDDEFFLKHYWGTSQINSDSCTLYKIEHPEWQKHVVMDSEINFDFGSIFGEEFAHLTHTEPDSIQLFDGSEVIVYRKKILT